MGYDLKFFKRKANEASKAQASVIEELRGFALVASPETKVVLSRLVATMNVKNAEGEEFGEELSGYGSYSRFLQWMGIELDPYGQHTAKPEEAIKYRDAYNRAKESEDFTINTWTANAIHPIAFALEAGYDVEFVWS